MRLCALVLIVGGLAGMATPALLDAFNAYSTSKALALTSDSARLDADKAEEAWEQACAYNVAWADGREDPGIVAYSQQLSLYGDNAPMASVSIPAVDIELPIYHGSDEDVLASGVGHLESSALPAGGEGTNCVLTGHSGLLASSMFDSLRSLEIGDAVEIATCGRTLYYEVLSMDVVEPEKAAQMCAGQEGKDILTLITCTSEPTALMPYGGYGVNDMRLVVTCDRSQIKNEASEQEEASRPVSWRWHIPIAAGSAVLLAGATGAIKRRLFAA